MAGEVATDVREEITTEDEAFEDDTVRDVRDEGERELMVIGFAPVPGAWYISSL